MFTIDNITFDEIVSDLERSFEVADNKSSGRTEDWTMHRDVEGTFYNYTIKFEPTFNMAKYNQLYQILSAPQEKHTVTMPYGTSTITFDAYVTKGKDKAKIRNNQIIWSGLSVNIIAIAPYRNS